MLLLMPPVMQMWMVTVLTGMISICDGLIHSCPVFWP